MSGEDGRQMVENSASREVLQKELEAGRKIPTDPKPPPEPRKAPAGTVERVLSSRDRNYIIGACRSYCQTTKHRKFKDLQRLERVKKILAFEETLEYNAAIADDLDDARLRWQGARNRYKIWLAVREGSDKLSDLKKEYPNLEIDPDGPEPARPPARPPEHDQETLAGPTRTFYLPAKVDAWVEEALARMDWPTDMTEGAVVLCEKYGVELDPDDKEEVEIGKVEGEEEEGGEPE